MKCVQLIACLMVCLVIMLSSCKKDPAFDADIKDNSVVKLDDRSARQARCLTDKRMEPIYFERTGYRSEIIEGRLLEMSDLEKNNSRSVADLPLFTVPVHVIVVHTPGQAPGSQTNISEARILSQIAALNLDFLRKNADANKTPPVFKTSGGQIQFCMASIDPKGQTTNGISRYATSQNFDNNELSIKKSNPLGSEQVP
ncbi:MAG: hypothetical protein IPL46_15035 [Saprospiraceae bacterium]|nr:hypothetical protein [Saprospiraceae bacterium]